MDGNEAKNPHTTLLQRLRWIPCVPNDRGNQWWHWHHSRWHDWGDLGRDMEALGLKEWIPEWVRNEGNLDHRRNYDG